MSNKKRARKRTPQQRENGREAARWHIAAGIHIKDPGRRNTRLRAIKESKDNG